jgi:DNA-binding response OmpR family regulator
MKPPIDILLVEDDPDDVELLRVAFQENNVPVQFTIIPQGHKALPHLSKCSKLPDIIILDLNLPKMHGFDVLTGIKLIEEYQTVPILILTTSSAKSDIDFCMRNGADQYIVKPVTMEEYHNIVNTVVALSEKK